MKELEASVVNMPVLQVPEELVEIPSERISARIVDLTFVLDVVGPQAAGGYRRGGCDNSLPAGLPFCWIVHDTIPLSPENRGLPSASTPRCGMPLRLVTHSTLPL